ncbi:MAG: hypothetical protein HC822_18685 [Oscillochloris sp.]|nr:hypothetical protein [Oscillochloris sp.]
MRRISVLALLFISLFPLAASTPAHAQETPTRGPAQLVADLGTETNGSVPENLYRVGNLLYFTASDGINGRQLWRTDGSVAGTFRLTDSQNEFNSIRFADRSGILFVLLQLSAFTGSHLYRSDGTAVGTYPITLLDTNTLPQLSSIATNNQGVFLSENSATESKLWFSDGTANSARLLITLPRTPNRGYLRELVAIDSGALFSYQGENQEELWFSDGTAAGTRMIRSFTVDTTAPTGSLVQIFNLSGGKSRAYFTVDTIRDETSFDETGVKVELWTSDGSAAGTHLLQSIEKSE